LRPTSRPDRAREAVFHARFREDLAYWVRTDRKVAVRILELVEAVMRDPFAGIGKPDPLRGLTDAWSRRVTHADRLVYFVAHERIVFLQARYHY
jgi:toxin YoeB